MRISLGGISIAICAALASGCDRALDTCRENRRACPVNTDAGIQAAGPLTYFTVEEPFIGQCGDYDRTVQWVVTSNEPGYVIQRIRLTASNLTADYKKVLAAQSCLEGTPVEFTYWEAFLHSPHPSDQRPEASTRADTFHFPAMLAQVDSTVSVEASAKFFTCAEIVPGLMPGDFCNDATLIGVGFDITAPTANDGEGYSSPNISTDPALEISIQNYAGGSPRTINEPAFWTSKIPSINRTVTVRTGLCCDGENALVGEVLPRTVVVSDDHRQ